MSICKMVGRACGSVAEGQPAEPLGIGDAGPPALLGRPSPHRLAGPAVLTGELGPMALDRGRLGLDRVADVHPFVGFEGRREEHRRHLVGGPGAGEMVRQRCGRSHRIEQRRPGDPVVPVVEVVLPEEDRRRVMPADDIGTEGAHPLHQGAPEVVGIGELAVREAEVLHTRQADECRRRLELGGALRQPVALGSTAGSVVPLPPSVHTTRCTALPALAQRARLPPQATSASSGWA